MKRSTITFLGIFFLSLFAYFMVNARRPKFGGTIPAYFTTNESSTWTTLFLGFCPELSTQNHGAPPFRIITAFGVHTLYGAKSRTKPLYWQ